VFNPLLKLAESLNSSYQHGYSSTESLYVRAKNQLLKLTCEYHLHTLSFQSKFTDSAELESSCRTWNRLLSGLRPCRLVVFSAKSSFWYITNFQWNIQSSAKCTLCDSLHSTTAHVLSGWPVALSYRFTYQHDIVLHSLVTSFVEVFVNLPFICIYADLPSLRASHSPLAMIPTTVMVTPFNQTLSSTIPLWCVHWIAITTFHKLGHINKVKLSTTTNSNRTGHFQLLRNTWNKCFGAIPTIFC